MNQQIVNSHHRSMVFATSFINTSLGGILVFFSIFFQTILMCPLPSELYEISDLLEDFNLMLLTISALCSLSSSFCIKLLHCSFTCWQSVPKFYHHHIIFSPSERPGIKYTWMPSPFCPDMISLILIKWHPVVFVNVLTWEHCATNQKVFGCFRVHIS